MLKRVVEVFTPGQVFSGRMMMATLALLPFAIREVRRVPRDVWPMLIVFSVLANFLTTFLYATAQTSIDSSLNGMINSLTPLMTLTVGAIIYRQRIRIFQVLGLLMGLAGTLLLVWQTKAGQAGAINWFALVAIGATAANGFTVNIVKFNLSKLSVIQLSSVSFLIIFPAAFGYALYSGFFPLAFGSDEGLVAMGYIVVLGVLANAMALIMLSKLIQISSPVFATMTTYLIPVVALYWGFRDGEIITSLDLVAMAIILVSVYVVDRFDQN